MQEEAGYAKTFKKVFTLTGYNPITGQKCYVVKTDNHKPEVVNGTLLVSEQKFKTKFKELK